MCPLEYGGCVTPGGWVTPKKLVFLLGFWGSKTISSYSFDWIVLIFGYIVERTNTKILSSRFLQFPSWTQIMTSIIDVISGFAKVVVAQGISWREVVSVFLYLLYFPSYDVINDVIMT